MPVNNESSYISKYHKPVSFGLKRKGQFLNVLLRQDSIFLKNYMQRGPSIRNQISYLNTALYENALTCVNAISRINGLYCDG